MKKSLTSVPAIVLIALLGCGDSGEGGSGGNGGSNNGGSPSAGGQGGTSSPSTSTQIGVTTTQMMGDVLAACDAPANPPSNGSCFTPPTVDPVCPPGEGGAGGGTGGAGGAGGGPTCTGTIPNANECGFCIESDCCEELSACQGIANCLDCVLGNQTGAVCEDAAVAAAIDAINSCIECDCVDECINNFCNPVTGEPCDVENGFACDLGADGYVCFGPPNDTPICDACDNANGPWCENGHTCLSDGSCAKYCCDDADCGSGKCDKTKQGNPDVGVCVKE
ncbi:MAG: hypothetical protein HOW73_29355 [Polyangiaceae bacterium]|nr:hypothetical protein [Polyangiaceae bacterium]